MGKTHFLMYVRTDDNVPIGAIMVKALNKDSHKVAVSLCHPKDLRNFSKQLAWNKLEGKLLSERCSKTFPTEVLSKSSLEQIFTEFGINHLKEFSYAGLPKTSGEIQREILKNNNEKFKRTFKMLVERVEKII